MIVEEKSQPKVEFKLNKESSFELSAAEGEGDQESASTFSCCIGCNTSGSVTSGCPAKA